MNKRRRIFFIIFGSYHLFIFFFVLFIEAQKADLSLLYSLYGKIAWMRWGSILGLLLFVIDASWNFFETKSSGKEKDAMRHENNTLKAKVYDLQQPGKEPVKASSSVAKP
jgi:hypothetical protein